MLTLSFDLEQKLCICIGGGAIAERRLKRLIDSHAKVIVISPQVTDQIRRWHNDKLLCWKEERYEPNCLQGAFLVLAATDYPDINQACEDEARRMGVLFNRVDKKESCNFSFPAEVQLGNLQMTFSSGKSSPRLTKLVSRDMLNRYAPLAEVLEELHSYRGIVKTLLGTPKEREEFWRRYLQEDDIQMILDGKWKQVEEKLKRAISSLGVKS